MNIIVVILIIAVVALIVHVRRLRRDVEVLFNMVRVMQNLPPRS